MGLYYSNTLNIDIMFSSTPQVTPTCVQQCHFRKMQARGHIMRSSKDGSSKFTKYNFMQSHFEYDFSSEMSRRIAQEFIKKMKTKRKVYREVPTFADTVRNEVLYLHEYNLTVFKVTQLYPFSEEYTQFLMQYVLLECKILYKREYYSKNRENQTQDRVIRLLLNVYNDYFESKQLKRREITEKSMKSIIEIFVKIRTQHNLKYIILENMTVSLLKKNGHFEKIDALRDKPLPFLLDSILSPDPSLSIYRNASTSDYGTDDGLSNISQTLNGDHNYELSPTLEDDVDEIKDECRAISENQEKDVNKNSKYVYTICLDESGLDSDEEIVFVEKEIEGKKKRRIKNSNMVTTNLTLNQKPPTSKNYQSENTIKSIFNENDVIRINDGDKLLQEIDSYLTDSDSDQKSVVAGFSTEDIIDISDDSTTSELPTIITADERTDFALTILSNSSQQNENQMEIIEPAANKNAVESTTMLSNSLQQIENQVEILDVNKDTEFYHEEINNRKCNKNEPNEFGIIDKAYVSVDNVADSSQIISMDSTDPFIKANKFNETNYDLTAVMSSGLHSSSHEDDSLHKIILGNEISTNDASKQRCREHRLICPKEIKINLYQCTLSNFNHFFIEGKSTETDCTLKNEAKVAVKENINFTEFHTSNKTEPDLLTEVLIIKNKKSILHKDINNFNDLLAKDANANDSTEETLRKTETSNKKLPRRYSLRSHEDFEEKHLSSANAEEVDQQIQKEFAVDNQKNELVQIPPIAVLTGGDEGSDIYKEDIISENISEVDKLKILEIDDHAKDAESGLSVVTSKSEVILVTFSEEKLSKTENIENIFVEDRHENKPTPNEKIETEIVQTIDVDAVFEKTVTNESQNLEIESFTFESKQITNTDAKGEEEQFQFASDDQTENKETTFNFGIDINEVLTNKEEEETSTISKNEDKPKIIETVTEILHEITKTDTEIRGRTLTKEEEISQSLHTGDDQTENEVIININEKVIEAATNGNKSINVSGLNQYEDTIATNEIIEAVTEIGEQINEIDYESHTKEEEISQIPHSADNQIIINYDEELFQDEHADEVSKIDKNEESMICLDTKFVAENKNAGIFTKYHSQKVPKFEEKIETLPSEIRSVELSKDVEVAIGTNVGNKKKGEIDTECSVSNETITHSEHIMEKESTLILEKINIEIPDNVDNVEGDMLSMQTLPNSNEDEDIHNLFITENKLETAEPSLQDRGGKTEEDIIEEICTENKDEKCTIHYEGVKTEGIDEETCISNKNDTSKIKNLAFDKELEGKSETLVLDGAAINKEPTQNEEKTSTEEEILDTNKNKNEQQNRESIEIVEGNANNIYNKKIGNEELRIILVDIEQSTNNVINKTSSIENDLGIQIEQFAAENIIEPKNKLAIVDTNLECCVEEEKRIENENLLKNYDELQVGRHVYEQKRDNLEEISQYATNSVETSHEYSFYKSPFINEVIVEAPVIEEEICFEIPKAVTHNKNSSCFFEQEVDKSINSEDVEKTKIVVSEETRTNLLEPGIINSIINNKELLLNDTNKLEDGKSFSINNFNETRIIISKESFDAPYDSTHPDWNNHKDKILNEEHFEDLHLLASVTVEIKKKSETPKSKSKRKHVKTTNSKKESADAKSKNVKNRLRKKIILAETTETIDDEKRMTRSAYRKNIFENIMKPQEFKNTLPINNVKIHQLPDYSTNKYTTDSDSNDSEFNKLFIDDNEVVYNEDTDEENHVFNYKPRIFCKNTKVTITKKFINKKPKTKAAIKSYENNLNPYVSIMRLEEKEDTVTDTEIVFPNNEYTVEEVALEKEILNKNSLLANVNLPTYIPPKLRYKLSCKNTVKLTTEKLVQRLKKEGTDLREMQEDEQICEKDIKQTIVETKDKADINVKSQINEIPISKKIKILSDVIIAPKRNNHAKMLEIVDALEINNSNSDNKADQPKEMSDNDDIEVIQLKIFNILDDTISKNTNSIEETPESFAEPKEKSNEDSIDVKEEISMKNAEIPIKNENKYIDCIENETKEIISETSKQSKDIKHKTKDIILVEDKIKDSHTKKNKEDTKHEKLIKERIKDMAKEGFIKDKNLSKRKSKDVEYTVCMKKVKKEIEENKKDRADKKLRIKTASMNSTRTNSTKNSDKVSKDTKRPKKDITKFRKDVGSDEVQSTEIESITANTKEIQESVKVNTPVKFLIQQEEIDELINKYNKDTKKTSRTSRRSSYLETHLDNKLEVDKKCVIVSTKNVDNISLPTSLRTSRNSRSKSYTEETETLAGSVETKLRSKSISIAEGQKLIRKAASKKKVDKNKTRKSCSIFKSKKDIVENKRVLRTKIEYEKIKSPSKLSKVLNTTKSSGKEKIQLDLVQSDAQQKIISCSKIAQIINENEDNSTCSDRISEEIHQKLSTSLREQKFQNVTTTEKSNQANIENLEKTEDKKSNVASDLQEMAINVVNEDVQNENIDKSYEDKNAKITNVSEEITEKMTSSEVEEYLEEKIITEKENLKSVEENGDKSMNITSIDTLFDEILHKKIIKGTNEDLQNEIINRKSDDTCIDLMEENLDGKMRPVIISEEIIYKEATNIVQEHLQNISEETIHKEPVNDLEVDLQNELGNVKSHETSIDLMEKNLDGKMRPDIISDEIIHEEVTDIVQEHLQNRSEEIIHKNTVVDLELDLQNEITNEKSRETRIDLMEKNLDGNVRIIIISEEIIHKEATNIVQEHLQKISDEIIHKEPVNDIEVGLQNEIRNRKSHETSIDLIEENLDGKMGPVIISEEIIHKNPVEDLEVDLQNEITNEKSHEKRIDLMEENLDGKVRPVFISDEVIQKEATNIVQEHLQNVSGEIIHKNPVKDLEVDLQNEITNEKSHEIRIDLMEENLDGKVRPVIITEEIFHKEATNIVQEHLQNVSGEIFLKEPIKDLEVDLQNEIINEKSHETTIDLMEENLDGKVRPVIITEEIFHKEATNIVQEHLQNVSGEIFLKEPIKDLEVDLQNEITNEKSHETSIDLMEENLDGKVGPVIITEKIIHKEPTNVVEVNLHNELTTEKSHQTSITKVEENVDENAKAVMPVIISEVILYKDATNIVQDVQLKRSNLLNEVIVTEKELDTISLTSENAPKAIILKPMKSSKEIYEETNDEIKQTGTENNNVNNETKKILTKMGDISTKQFYGTITTNAEDNSLSFNLGLDKVEELNLVRVTNKEQSNCRKYVKREKIRKLSSGIRHTITKRPRKCRHNLKKILYLEKLDGIDVSKIMSKESKTINCESLPSNLKKYQSNVSYEPINCLPISHEKLLHTDNEILDQNNAYSPIGNDVPVELHESENTHQELDITEADNVIAEEIIVKTFRLENENQWAIEETVEEFKIDTSENLKTFEHFDTNVLNDTSGAVSPNELQPKKAASQSSVILASDKNSDELMRDTIMEKPQNIEEKTKKMEEKLTVIFNDLVIKQNHADVIHDKVELTNIPLSRAASFEVFKNEENKIDNVEEKFANARALENAIFKTDDYRSKDMREYNVNETEENHNTLFAIDPIQGDKNINEIELKQVPITDVSFENGKNKNGKTELLEEHKFVDIEKLKYSSVIEDSTLKSNQNKEDYIRNDKETIIENFAKEQNQENTVIHKENPKIKSAYEVTIDEETIKDETPKESLSETLKKNTISQTDFKEDSILLQPEHKETDFDTLAESEVPETSLEYSLAREALDKSLVSYKNSVDISQHNENSTEQVLVRQRSFGTSPADSMAALDSELKIQGDKQYADISNKCNNAEYLCSTDKHIVFEGTTPKLQDGSKKCSTVLETPDFDRILVPFFNNQDFASPELKNNMEESIVKPKIRTVVVDEDLHKPGTSRQSELVDNLVKQVHPVELQKLHNQPQENLQNPATIEEIMENRLHFENQFYLPQGNQLSSSTQMRVLDGTNDHNYSYWDCPSDPVMSIAEDGGEMSLNAKEFGNVILNFGNENEFLDFTSSLLDLDLPDENTSRRESEPFTSWDNEPKVIVVLNEQYNNQPCDSPVVIIGDISDCTVSEPWGQQESGKSQQSFHDGSIDLFSQQGGPGNPILAEEITIPTSESSDTNIKMPSEISNIYDTLNITSDTVSVDKSSLESICNDKREEINQNLCIGESSSEKADTNSDSSNSRNSSPSESTGKSKKVEQQLALYKQIQAKRSSQNHMKCNNLEIPSRKCVRASPRNWTKLSSLPSTKLNESPKLNAAEKLEVNSQNKPINNITPPVINFPSDFKKVEPPTDGMDIKQLITEKKRVMKHPTTSISNKVMNKNETSTTDVFSDLKEMDKKLVTTRETTNVNIDEERKTLQSSEIDCKNNSSLDNSSLATKISTKTESTNCSKTENSESQKLPTSDALRVSKSPTKDLIKSVTYPIISKTSINRVQEKTTTILKQNSYHQESEISSRSKNHEITFTVQHCTTLEISQKLIGRSSDLSHSRVSSLSPNDSERSSRDRSSRGGSETSSFGYDDIEVTSNLYDTVKSRKRAVTKRDSSVESKSRYDYKTSRNKRKKRSPNNYKISKKSKISGNNEEKEIQERISIADNLKVKIRLDGTMPYPMHSTASSNQNSFSSSYTVDNILKQKEPAKDRISRDNFQDWDKRNTPESGSKSKIQKPSRSTEDAFDHLISQGNINPCFSYNSNQATSNSTNSDRPDLSQHSYKRSSDRSSVDLNYISKRRPEEQSNIRKNDRCRRIESSQRNSNFRTSTELNRSQQGQRPSTEYYHKYPLNYSSRDREGSYFYRKSSSSSRQSQQFSSHGSSNSNVTNAYRRNEEHKKHQTADTPLYTTNGILTDEKKNELLEDLRNVVQMQLNKSSKSNSEADWYHGIAPLLSENQHGFNKRE